MAFDHVSSIIGALVATAIEMTMNVIQKNALERHYYYVSNLAATDQTMEELRARLKTEQWRASLTSNALQR